MRYNFSLLDRFNFKSLNEYEILVDKRSHCSVTETWEQLRRPRSINLDIALNKLQLMKIIKLLHDSAQFLKNS